jgi:hypothetical protein
LLKIPPQADVEAEKIRLELTEMEKTDEIRKKEATREISLKNTTKTEKQKKSKEEAQKKSPKKERPSKQRAQVIAKQEFVSEEEEEEAVYVANVPVQKNAFLAVQKKKQTTRASSPQKKIDEEPPKTEVSMPSKKQIDRDLSAGFVVVQKKGPPPLTPEQRKEREALRQKEEEEEKRKEAESYAREKERDKRRLEAAVVTDVTLDHVKAKLDKQKIERQTKQEEKKQVKHVIKQYTKASPEIEEAERERRTWGATVIAEGETATADLQDYPQLRPVEMQETLSRPVDSLQDELLPSDEHKEDLEESEA